MAFYKGIRISEQASPVFWQVGAPRSPFGKFWTMDGHSMIRVDEISEQGSVRTSDVGGFLQRDFCKGIFAKGFLHLWIFICTF